MTRKVHFAIKSAAVGIIIGCLGAGAASAEPGGCLKYGAVGAVGGHLAHHGVVGAAGGCAVGMYKRHEYRKQQRAIARQGESAAVPPAGDQPR